MNAAAITDLARESIRSGTIASLAMMPFGWAFNTLGLRIGHYGKKLIEVGFGELAPASFRVLLMIEHLLIGWISAAPLLWWLLRRDRQSPWIIGLIYGAAYYVLINSLALPIAFGDPLPWQLGVTTVLPSLVVHLVFGLVIVWASRSFVRLRR